MSRRPWCVLAIVAAAAGCGGQPIPREIEFDGERLRRVGTWTMEERAESVGYVPAEGDHESPEWVVGLIFGYDIGAEELSQFVMRNYRAYPGNTRHYDESYGTSACKVGSTDGRPFVAVHDCVPHADQGSVCVELDRKEVLSEICLLTNEYCWERVCRERLAEVLPKFQALLERSFEDVELSR